MDIEKYLQSGKLEQYVLGLSSTEERKEVEQLAKEFKEIDDYILELHNCMNLCSEANEIPIAEEPEKKYKCKTFHLKSKRNLVPEYSAAKSSQKLIPISWSMGIASFFVIGLSTLSFFLYQSQQSAKKEIALLETQIHHLELDNEALLNDGEKLLQQYTVLKDVNTKLVNLQGLGLAPQAHGMVYWNQDHHKAYLSICNLPKAPDGHQLCVWADVKGKHQKVADLNLDNVALLHDLSFKKGCNGFCITIEKEGVSNTNPTIDKMIVKGDMLWNDERTID